MSDSENASRTSLNSGTTPVRPGFELDATLLDSWFRAHVPGFRGPATIEQFRGGQSNPTYRISTPASAYVLRRKPAGTLQKSAHAVDREYRVLRALESTSVPVPRALAQCQDPSVLGTPFYVMEFKPGRVFWDLVDSRQFAEERAALWDQANTVLAHLHRLDPTQCGLADFGPQGNYFERQFRRWSQQYEIARLAVPNPAMDRLSSWLAQRIPADESARIVHGDFQFSNLIYDAGRPTVAAVLDWELSTLGHPLSDLAYFCRVYHLAPGDGGLRGLDLATLGIPSERGFVDRYLERTGFALAAPFEFYVVFAMFRLAAIRQGVAQRVRNGTASSAHATLVGASAVPVAEAAWEIAQRLD